MSSFHCCLLMIILYWFYVSTLIVVKFFTFKSIRHQVCQEVSVHYETSKQICQRSVVFEGCYGTVTAKWRGGNKIWGVLKENVTGWVFLTEGLWSERALEQNAFSLVVCPALVLAITLLICQCFLPACPSTTISVREIPYSKYPPLRCHFTWFRLYQPIKWTL